MKRRPWTQPEIKRLLHFYPHIRTPELAAVLRRPLTSCFQMAARHGVRKSEEFFARPELSGRTDGTKGISGRFKKGHKPVRCFQKGEHVSPSTEFRKGNKPQTWVPVGTEVVRDGYLTRKITDNRTVPSRFNWKGVHVILWEKHHGPVPRGHAVIFKNGNKSDIRIENLELLTRGQLMLRNTIHNYPPAVKEIIRLTGKLRRTIKRKNDEQEQPAN